MIELAVVEHMALVSVCYYGTILTLLYCEKDNIDHARYSYRALGAHARSLFFVHQIIELESLEEILLREGNEQQLTKKSFVLAAAVEQCDARLFIASRSNTKALSSIKPERVSTRRKAFRDIYQISQKREQAGKFRWSSTLYPTTAYAQDAEMSLHNFEEFVFSVGR